MKKRRSFLKTDFLLPNNNFIVGMGSVMNISGTYFKYKTSESGEEADKQALKSDWENVGEDIRTVMSKFQAGRQ